jgi:hypothetical protein
MISMPVCKKDLHNLNSKLFEKNSRSQRVFFITAFFITKMFSAFVKQLNKRDNAQQKSKKTTFCCCYWNWLKPTPPLLANKDKSLYLPHREKEDH